MKKLTKLPRIVVSAPVYMRVGAFVVDYLMIGAIVFSAYYILNLVPLSKKGVLDCLRTWPMFLCLLGYFAIMESSKYQATLGKLLFRLKVCDYSFEKISFFRATARYLARAVLGVSLFVLMWSQNMQGLHDMLTRTVILEKKDLNDLKKAFHLRARKAT